MATRLARTLAYHRARARPDTDAGRRHARLAADALDTLHADDCCEDCGTPLEDPVSVKRGVGPHCWEKRRRPAARDKNSQKPGAA